MKENSQNIGRIQLMDTSMRRLIMIGGVGCLAIFVFLFAFLFFQVKPLLGKPSWSVEQTDFTLEREGLLLWDARVLENGILVVSPDEVIGISEGNTRKRSLIDKSPLLAGEVFTASTFELASESLWLGTSQGRLFRFIRDTSLTEELFVIDTTLEVGPESIECMDSHTFMNRQRVAVVSKSGDRHVVNLVEQVNEQTPLGVGEGADTWDIDAIDSEFDKDVEALVLSSNRRNIALRVSDGSIHVLSEKSGDWEKGVAFGPTINSDDSRFAAKSFGFAQAGRLITFLDNETGNLVAAQTRQESDEIVAIPLLLDDEVSDNSFAIWQHDQASPASAIAHGKRLRIVNLSLNRVLGTVDISEALVDVEWDSRSNQLWLLGQSGTVYRLQYDAAYLDYYTSETLFPESSELAGRGGWQPSVASPQIQSGYDLTPLILGTLKGTFLALLVAAPFAILSAIYTSQFARHEVRGVIKPCLELLGSFPSVVLGFICAFWLNTYIEAYFTEILCFVFLLPLVTVISTRMSFRVNRSPAQRFSFAYESVYFGIIFFVSLLVSVGLGKLLDFTITSSISSEEMAAYTLLDWLEVTFGVNYEQRNALTVSVILGFATIPFMYSLMDDALSLVPGRQRIAALSLGASRLQMILTILLPAAAPGLLGAILISMSRCLGETMIFVMVAGNADTVGLSLFEGFRTLSATLAIELPEARVGSTLYRTLFLAAWVLLCLTFIVNTTAAILRSFYERRFLIQGGREGV